MIAVLKIKLRQCVDVASFWTRKQKFARKHKRFIKFLKQHTSPPHMLSMSEAVREWCYKTGDSFHSTIRLASNYRRFWKDE